MGNADGKPTFFHIATIIFQEGIQYVWLIGFDNQWRSSIQNGGQATNTKVLPARSNRTSHVNALYWAVDCKSGIENYRRNQCKWLSLWHCDRWLDRLLDEHSLPWCLRRVWGWSKSGCYPLLAFSPLMDEFDFSAESHVDFIRATLAVFQQSTDKIYNCWQRKFEQTYCGYPECPFGWTLQPSTQSGTQENFSYRVQICYRKSTRFDEKVVQFKTVRQIGRKVGIGILDASITQGIIKWLNRQKLNKN